MPRKECLEHPGCIWSCPCDCLNCINFETVLRRQSRPEVAYSPAAASSPRDVSNSGLWASSSCEGRVFSETFYDALLPPPGVEPQPEEKEPPAQAPGSQTASLLLQATAVRNAKKPGA